MVKNNTMKTCYFYFLNKKTIEGGHKTNVGLVSTFEY